MEGHVHSGEMSHAGGEMSLWPFLVGLSSLAVVLGFTTAFQWHGPVAGVLIGGLGVMGVIIALFGWLSEVHGDAPSAGLSPVAVIFFILSEVALFGGLFTSYLYVLLPAAVWPPLNTPPHVPPLGFPLFLTLFLLFSSVTFHTAESRLKAGDPGGFKGYLTWTFFLGAFFLYGQISEWKELLRGGFTASTNIYSTFFYVITGFHGSHVVVGLILQLFIFILHTRGKIRSGHEAIVRACGYYWHFVDGIWLVVLSLVYVLPYLER